ncbi:MAG: insulinase family protein [Solobacterium sp.]|nr:insulinase family protein [Solobacterium sp.]
MKQNERFRECWEEYTCKNGLRLVLFHKPQFFTSSFLLMTPFGNLDHIQKDASGTLYQSPSGVAHFLEHKLFESDHDDVMMEFNRLGANVNASTSYDMTSYFFTTPAQDIQKPLNLLLDFVQQLSITEESVAREQKIILEELAMYRQDPDSRLFYEAMKAVYQSHPIRDDIVGTESSIRAITKSELERTYARNYHPSRMTLLAITPQEPRRIIELVEENQSHKSFGEQIAVERVIEPEPEAVYEPLVNVPMAIEHPRCAVCFKLPVLEESYSSQLKREWALRLSLEARFSPINPEYQSWIDTEQITPYFGYDIDCSMDCSFLYFQDESADSQRIYAFVKQQLEQMKQKPILEESLQQMKRRMIGSIIRVMDNPMDMISSWSRGMVRGITIFEECEIVESLDPKFCLKTVQEISLNSFSCINLVPDRENAKNL